MKKIMFEKPGTMLYPLPAVMVSCGTEPEEFNIITIAWTGTVNSDPPMLFVSIRKSRHSYDIIKRTGEFVVNLTTEKLVEATDYCGVKSGRDVDKFAEKKLTPMGAKFVKCPMIAESPVNIECRVTQVIELGSHDMFLAEVLAVHADQDLMDKNGKLNLERAGLLTFSHGGYFGVKQKCLGRFGYSIMKPKTAKRIARERQSKKTKK
ncbi:MAG: flavin reductase family protein [Firmicutes bacterium]|nr:flavin reductase family protein [Bacillota bacterium]